MTHVARWSTNSPIPGVTVGIYQLNIFSINSALFRYCTGNTPTNSVKNPPKFEQIKELSNIFLLSQFTDLELCCKARYPLRSMFGFTNLFVEASYKMYHFLFFNIYCNVKLKQNKQQRALQYRFDYNCNVEHVQNE